MRITHIITTLVYGGAERLLVNFANIHADSCGYDIDIIYLKGEPQLATALSPRIQVHQAPLGRDITHRLHRMLSARQPDIVHTHLGHADFLGLWAARRLPAKKFCTMHNIWFKWDWRDYLIFGGYYALFNRVAPDTHVIAISESVAGHVHRRLRVGDERIHTIYNGIPDLKLSLSRQQLREKLGIPEQSFCVLFVGRLRVQKSVDTLLRAVAAIQPAIRELQVIIIGEGPEYDYLCRLTNELSLAQIVQFRGTTHAPEEYFGAADVFVLPSVFEGLGLVILEAFRASLPVIATEIEGPKELIQGGVNGLLFAPKDHEQLATNILHLYQNPELRQQLATAGNLCYRNRFSIGVYAKAIADLYQQMNPIQLPKKILA